MCTYFCLFQCPLIKQNSMLLQVENFIQGLASIVDKNPELMTPEEIITTYQKLLILSSR